MLNLVATTVFLSESTYQVSAVTYLLGFSVMMIWVAFIKYFDYSSEYSFVPRTLSTSVPVTLRTLGGILPVYIGVAFLGMCIWWESYRFSEFNIALFSLYAIMNGDMVWDTYHDISGLNFIMACLYMYVYVFFAVAIV